MDPAQRWLMRLGQELAPLQIGNGGPIILVQVENEYGSFGNDHAYMEQIHHTLLDAGFTKAQLYTADGPEQLPDGSLPELPAAINLRPRRSAEGLRTAQEAAPRRPIHEQRILGRLVRSLGRAPRTPPTPSSRPPTSTGRCAQGYSISLYMFHGGTSFGWMNGANSNGKNYEPDVTSYDYDSPLDESGRPTPKYFLFRDVIAKGHRHHAAARPASRTRDHRARRSRSRSRPRSGAICHAHASASSRSPWKTSTRPTATSSIAPR